MIYTVPKRKVIKLTDLSTSTENGNTTDPFDIIKATIPANYLKVGDIITTWIWGELNTVQASDYMLLAHYVFDGSNGFSLAYTTNTSSAWSNGTAISWFQCQVKSIGASGNGSCMMRNIIVGYSSSGVDFTYNIDTTQSIDIKATGTFNNADASTYFHADGGYISITR